MGPIRLLMALVTSFGLIGVLLLNYCAQSGAAEPANWLDELDLVAKEFTGEIVLEGRTVPLEGPRRMAFYEPKPSEVNPVFAGACYALHTGGNPEVIIAIENSGDPAAPNTYIEISRLSGAAINVYRKGQKVAEFPRAAGVSGAYVGMVK